jgi:MYXO-CTERM domain-containing protein
MLRKSLAPLLLMALLAQPALVSAQVDSPTTAKQADRDDRDGLGWLGLLGLIGLLGLRRRDRDNVNDVRVPRSTV